jgi:adenylate cyclase class 2
MREIEIKLRVPNMAEVSAKLKGLSCVLSEPKNQEDINFIHKDDTRWFESNSGNWIYPRLRIENNKTYIFTIKKPIKNEMDCEEVEIKIDSPKEIKAMMKLFDYIEGVTVKKTRQTCTYKDYTITLDEVEKLGSFVEIERVVTDGDALKIQEEMFRFAKDVLGLEKDDEVMKGYDILLYLMSS